MRNHVLMRRCSHTFLRGLHHVVSRKWPGPCQAENLNYVGAAHRSQPRNTSTRQASRGLASKTYKGASHLLYIVTWDGCVCVCVRKKFRIDGIGHIFDTLVRSCYQVASSYCLASFFGFERSQRLTLDKRLTVLLRLCAQQK